MVTLTTALHPPEKVNTRHRDTKTHREIDSHRDKKRERKQGHTQRT